MLIGHYINCDEATCIDCFDGARMESFASIYSDSEADTPTHCHKCETLIEHNLTADGRQYVADAVLAYFASNRGRKEILAQWVKAYLHDTLSSLT